MEKSIDTEKRFGVECLLFESLRISSIKRINKLREFRTYKKGEQIFAEGNIPQGVYCIHEGHVKIFRAEKKEQIIYLGKPGDLIGWQQLTCDDPYTTSAVALEKCLISYISKREFLDIVSRYNLSVPLTRYICDDVIRLESKILELSQKSVRERLAMNILMLNEKFGCNLEDKVVISVPLTREDFANLVGTNTETVIKLLSELRKDGHIDFLQKKIIVLNINALRKFSGAYR